MIWETYNMVPWRKKRIAEVLIKQPKLLEKKSKEIQDMIKHIIELKEKQNEV